MFRYLTNAALVIGVMALSPLSGESTDIVTNCEKNVVRNAFTGRITRDRVRLRAAPSLEGSVIRELKKGELLAAVTEEEGFYGVKPPAGTKVYVYRTFILDGVVEGNRVNVRLSPDTESPIVAQLMAGEKVQGRIAPESSKWYEINPPSSTLFYVATDFLENVGDPDYLTRVERRREEAKKIYETARANGQSEMQKNFEHIDYQAAAEGYERVIHQYPEFSELVAKSKEQLTELEAAYLKKKIEFLEMHTKKTKEVVKSEDHAPQSREQTSTSGPHRRGEESTASRSQINKFYEKWLDEKYAREIDARMALWVPVEIALYEEWANDNGQKSIHQYYENQRQHAVALRGIVEPYDRPIRNKPGDYLIVNTVNRKPIAYLYSTQVNLQELIGQEITVEAVLRPNNHFAFPAYFVIDRIN